MADDVPISFFPSGGLYLKTVSHITIEVRLPEIRNPGVTVSNWEIMERIKEQSKPEQYQTLRVELSSRELIRFSGEFESVRALRKAVLLLNGKSIKLKGFPDPLRIQAHQTLTDHPSRQKWEMYFQDRGVESFDEGKPGERADTVHVKGLPVRWFSSKTSGGKPCPKVLTDAFEKFGKVRQVGFYDPSEESTQKGFASFGPGAATQVLNFEAYVQYEKYSGFCSAMEGLRNVQILRLQSGGQGLAKISVDFDRTGFLSERGIRKRLHLEEKRKREREEEERLREEAMLEEERKRKEEMRAKEMEEEDRKRRKSEEKRERKKEQVAIAGQLREIAIKRRTEAQRLMGVLLARAAETKYKEELVEKKRKEKERKIQEDLRLREELLENVRRLEQRKQELENELKLRLADGSGKKKKKKSSSYSSEEKKRRKR